jgi:hypothetical protein
MKYAVMIDIELGHSDYVRENSKVFTDQTPVQLYDTKEEAQAEANTWNTGRVVEWHDGHR